MVARGGAPASAAPADPAACAAGRAAEAASGRDGDRAPAPRGDGGGHGRVVGRTGAAATLTKEREDMNELPCQDVAARLDELMIEVRRQGRAAIAAQAAAESCLEAVRELGDQPSGDGEGVDGSEEAARWLRALIP